MNALRLILLSSTRSTRGDNTGLLGIASGEATEESDSLCILVSAWLDVGEIGVSFEELVPQFREVLEWERSGLSAIHMADRGQGRERYLLMLSDLWRCSCVGCLASCCWVCVTRRTYIRGFQGGPLRHWSAETVLPRPRCNGQ
jgi:hypothetical protein